MKYTTKSAFTLAEMLVVIVIIGILSVALIPRITGVQARARDTARLLDMTIVGQSLELYALDNEWSYPVAPFWANKNNLVAQLGTGENDPTTYNALSSSLGTLDQKLWRYIANIPQDPWNGVVTYFNGWCEIQGNYFAYSTNRQWTTYAITSVSEWRKWNTNNCAGVMNQNKNGSYHVTGKGLIDLIPDNSYTWVDVALSCFEYSKGLITQYKTQDDSGKQCSSSVVIPSMIWSELIQGIAKSAFEWQNITSITFPVSIIYIWDNAFARNQLSAVSLPPYLSYIGQYAFTDNKLTSITIPLWVREIQIGSFFNNPLLTSLSIASSIESIWQLAFIDSPIPSVTLSKETIYYEDSFHPNTVITILGEDDDEWWDEGENKLTYEYFVDELAKRNGDYDTIISKLLTNEMKSSQLTDLLQEVNVLAQSFKVSDSLKPEQRDEIQWWIDELSEKINKELNTLNYDWWWKDDFSYEYFIQELINLNEDYDTIINEKDEKIRFNQLTDLNQSVKDLSIEFGKVSKSFKPEQQAEIEWWINELAEKINKALDTLDWWWKDDTQISIEDLAQEVDNLNNELYKNRVPDFDNNKDANDMTVREQLQESLINNFEKPFGIFLESIDSGNVIWWQEELDTLYKNIQKILITIEWYKDEISVFLSGGWKK